LKTTHYGHIIIPNNCSVGDNMPFGFDPLEAEKAVKEIRDDKQRVYLDVVADWLPDGRILPLSFTWEDDREFKVGKILSVVKGHSLKAFAPGMRYRCQTGRRYYYLHYDGERWYIVT
jgi:hypothetical protein